MLIQAQIEYFEDLELLHCLLYTLIKKPCVTVAIRGKTCVAENCRNVINDSKTLWFKYSQ